MTGIVGNNNDLSNDGTALRIASSVLRAEHYNNAPRIVSLQPPMPVGCEPPAGSNKWTLPFVVKDTAQLGPEDIIGTIAWDTTQVASDQVPSGSPGMLLVSRAEEAAAEEGLVCPRSTNGIGAGL
ncbi:MAG: hypothetical protein Q9226_005489, partial [Calogaya cf. arnoldii]